MYFSNVFGHQQVETVYTWNLLGTRQSTPHLSTFPNRLYIQEDRPIHIGERMIYCFFSTMEYTIQCKASCMGDVVAPKITHLLIDCIQTIKTERRKNEKLEIFTTVLFWIIILVKMENKITNDWLIKKYRSFIVWISSFDVKLCQVASVNFSNLARNKTRKNPKCWFQTNFK